MTKKGKTLGGDWQLQLSTQAATLNMAIGEISWRKSRESCLTEAVRELSRGCGAAKMEPAAAGPGPLIVNNKQPQPPPPPPPATAQPPPGTPRAAGSLLPGGKAREFNRNQRKDSEVRAAGGRGWHGAGGRGGPGPGAAAGPSRASGWLDTGLGAVSLPKTVQLERLAAATAPERKARSPVTNSDAARGEGPGAGDGGSAPGGVA